MRKTCWYTTIHPLRVGALVGSAGSADVTHMVRFGFHLGAAFQIRDDLLNLVGDEETYGKEILGDLYEGKRTLTLIHLLSSAEGADGALLRDYLRRNRAERSEHMVRTVRRLMDDYGSIDYTASTPRASCWWPRSTSNRPSPTPTPDRTSTSCARWCPTCGPAGAEIHCVGVPPAALTLIAGGHTWFGGRRRSYK